MTRDRAVCIALLWLCAALAVVIVQPGLFQ